MKIETSGFEVAVSCLLNASQSRLPTLLLCKTMNLVKENGLVLYTLYLHMSEVDEIIQ